MPVLRLARAVSTLEVIEKAVHLAAKLRQNRMEDHFKRQLEGNLVESELVEFECIGAGSFGKVMTGEYYGRPVAIKRAANSCLSADERESFR